MRTVSKRKSLKPFRKIILYSFTLLLSGFIQQNVVAGPITDLFVFGDSLNENGNLQALDAAGLVPVPGPFPGRFTNGPTATEILAAQIGLTLAPSILSVNNPTTDSVANNYAIAGARARNLSTSLFPTTTPRPYLAQQTAAAIGQAGGILAPNALYLIFIGGNDVADAVLAGPVGGATVINDAVNAILTGVTNLQAAGAQNFLVVNAPNVGDSPRFRSLGPTAVTGANALVTAFNNQLASRLSGMAGVSIFDVLTATRNYISSGAAAADGITNFTTPCSLITASLCRDNSFFYADSFHVTAPVQAFMGRALINAAVVPEPAPLTLLGFGLLGLAFMRKRKA